MSSWTNPRLGGSQLSLCGLDRQHVNPGPNYCICWDFALFLQPADGITYKYI